MPALAPYTYICCICQTYSVPCAALTAWTLLPLWRQACNSLSSNRFSFCSPLCFSLAILSASLLHTHSLSAFSLKIDEKKPDWRISFFQSYSPHIKIIQLLFKLCEEFLLRKIKNSSEKNILIWFCIRKVLILRFSRYAEFISAYLRFNETLKQVQGDGVL